MKIKTFILITLVSILSAACINPALKQNSQVKQNNEIKQNTGVKLNPTKSSDANEYLNFAEAFSNMPPDAQKQALTSTSQALALNPNELAQRMNLVMIVGLPSSNLLDTPKAQYLLQQILQEDILSGTQLAFAHVLFDYLVAANKINKSTRDDTKRVELLQQKNEALQIKLDAAQQKLEVSQQKLDELKKIEKSMGERESAPKK